MGLMLAAGVAQAASNVDRPAMPVASAPTAAAAPVSRFSDADAASIARVEAYLTAIPSIVADFNQVSADGSTGSGKFYLKRPGKMRWQYNPPTPILLVSNGASVTYYDASLDQVSYVGMDDTMAGFLARREIKLDSESTKLTQFEAADGVIRATMVQRKKPDEGSLTLEFNENPLQLRQMAVVDATGNSTRIQLQNATFGPVLDDRLFVFEDPRGVTPRKKQ